MNGVGGRGCGVQKRTAEHEKRAIWARFLCSAVLKGGEGRQASMKMCPDGHVFVLVGGWGGSLL